MQIHATRQTLHLALAGALVVLAGLLLYVPAMVGWGGAMLVAVAAARGMTRLAIVRVRLAGLEMVWQTKSRIHRVVRSGQVRLGVLLRNRDTVPARFSGVRAVAAAELDVQVSPREGTILGPGETTIEILIPAPRVGRFGVHGLMLDMSGPFGMFEVPLGFASAIGIESLPKASAGLLRSARGGRARRAAPSRRSQSAPGDGTELYELREHLTGDPFKRIAWKASAHRGQLMVKELEREERDVVWLVLDASGDLWAGPLGRAPLDTGIDALATLAARHLAVGDRVGLVVSSDGPERLVGAETGAAHAMRIQAALAFGASTLAADRSDWTEEDVARVVLEHLRFFDSKHTRIRSRQIDAVAAAADSQRRHAPFDLPAPAGPTVRDRMLRRYAACFGICAPARIPFDRTAADRGLVSCFERLLGERARPSIVYVWAKAPDTCAPQLATAIRKVRRVGATVWWLPAAEDRAVEPPQDDEIGRIAAFAVATRAKAARERGEGVVRACGARVMRSTSHP